VLASASERSPSVDPALSGGNIRCVSCHGNSDPTGPRGPHGSNVRYLLNAEYNLVDGMSESEGAYALCYRCHDRESVMRSSPFRHHASHVQSHLASCATCHDAHGSRNNRALIRFDATNLGGRVSPSLIANRLEFESIGPGSGSCYLTCHGFDHAPESYGISRERSVDPNRRLGSQSSGSPRTSDRRPRERGRQR